MSRSSTEYWDLAEIASELKWISYVLRDLEIPQRNTSLLLSDNIYAVHLTANPKFHNRTKHFDIDYQSARQKVTLSHIPASLQLAGIFTKSLMRLSFLVLQAKLGVGPPPNTSLRGDESVYKHKKETKEKQQKSVLKDIMDYYQSSPVAYLRGKENKIPHITSHDKETTLSDHLQYVVEPPQQKIQSKLCVRTKIKSNKYTRSCVEV